MRILIHGINFAPELTGIGKYTGELAAYLVEQGYQVRVVTTPPYYPQWKIAREYSPFVYREETWRGVEIYRCPLWVPQKPTGIKRVFHLASFALSSFPVMLYQVLWKPDLVFSVVPTTASAPFSLIAARLAGSKAWVHIQDFELDTANCLGILPVTGLFKKLISSLETICFQGFDRVSTISQRMLENLWCRGVPGERSVLFPNWVDEKLIFPAPRSEQLRAEWGIEKGQTLVLYSGSMGQKQGLEVLLDCAGLLREEKDIFFFLCGEGAVRPFLEERAKDIPNLHFLPLQPVERLNALLNSADIHVLPQRADAADLVMPSKLGGMLASGRPVVATAHPKTELAQLLNKVGLLVPPEDPSSLAATILYLVRHPEKQEELGSRGRLFIEQNWSKDQVLSGFTNEINALLSK